MLTLLSLHQLSTDHLAQLQQLFKENVHWCFVNETTVELSHGDQVCARLVYWDDPSLKVEAALAQLSAREWQIARLLKQELKNREIAEKTVERHIGRILDKLGLKSRFQVAPFIPDEPETEPPA